MLIENIGNISRTAGTIQWKMFITNHIVGYSKTWRIQEIYIEIASNFMIE